MKNILEMLNIDERLYPVAVILIIIGVMFSMIHIYITLGIEFPEWNSKKKIKTCLTILIIAFIIVYLYLDCLYELSCSLQ